ncbi:hypothetical protein AB0M23_16970 [Streptomyces sp. NPDC052077]|uniref:hypothetical protein n=1 Tax=Streptomyces sp. NPDC052077 TaxID=3154757 RepID=UPI00342A15C4
MKTPGAFEAPWKRQRRLPPPGRSLPMVERAAADSMRAAPIQTEEPPEGGLHAQLRTQQALNQEEQ